MASQNLNVGTAANANNGDTLRAAFINVRKMFHEIYGISATYADDLDLSGANFSESVQDIIGGMVSGNTESNITVTYDDTNNKLNFSVAADIDDINTEANSGLSGGVDSGAATLTLDLNNLTSATVDVATDSIAIVDASDSDASKKESIADIMTAVAGSGMSATSGVLSVDSIGTSGITNNAVTPEKVNLLADDLAATDTHIMVADGTDFSNVAMSGDATLSNAGLLTIGNNKITHAKLEDRYTAKVTSSSTGTQNLDASTASVFLMTGAMSTATLTIQNLKLGQTIDIVFMGSMASAVLTLNSNFTNEVFFRVGDTELDQAEPNIVQVTCVDDTDTGARLAYSINKFTAGDDTP